MSLKINSLIYLIIFPVLLYGQVVKEGESEKHLSVGVQFGSGAEILYGNKILKEYNKPILGALAGPEILIDLSGNLTLTTGFNFNIKGTHKMVGLWDTLGNSTGKGIAYTRLSYLTFPIKIIHSSGKNFKWIYGGGIFFSKLIGEGDDYVEGLPDYILQVYSYYSPFDMGIIASAGFIVPLGSTFSFSLELENQLGLKRIKSRNSYKGEINHWNTESLNLIGGLRMVVN